MADIQSKVVVSVYAQTNDAVREINKAQEALKGLGDQGSKTHGGLGGFIKDVTEGLGKFNLAVGGVRAAFDVLNGALDTALSQQRRAAMEKMLPSGAVDRFREATDKLISRQDVLRLSVKGLSGDFKLTESEMTTVLKAAVALEQKGFGPAAETADKLLEALAQGVNKLDDFGINLEKTNNRQADVNAAMSKFRDLIAETPVDEQTKSLMQLKDALVGIGEAVAYMIAEAVKAAAWLAKAPGNYMSGSKTVQTMQSSKDRQKAEMARRVAEANPNLYTPEQWAYLTGLGEQAEAYQGPGYVARGVAAVSPWLVPMQGPANAPTDADTIARMKWESSQKGAIPVVVVDIRGGVAGKYGTEGIDTLGAYQTPERTGGGYAVGSAGGIDVAGLGRRTPGLGGLQFGGEGFVGSQDLADLGTRKFGYSDFQQATIGGGIDAGTAGMMAGIEAIIEGQGAVGSAIAKASQQALKAKAIEWGAFAIGEGAWALADLAMGNVAGATAHGAAAAKFAIAAAAAGVGAGALGMLSGGGGAGASGSAGGGYAGRPSGPREAQQGGGTIIINIGDGFVGSPRELAEQVGQAVRDSERRGGRSNSNYSARYSG